MNYLIIIYMPIKHLVISGGGPNILTLYGALKNLNQNDYWTIENIKSIYGTSAGSLIGLFIILNLEWEELDNYLIKRPWNTVFKI